MNLVDLPEEILTNIFKRCDLLPLTLVSKGFNEFISNSPVLMKRIALKILVKGEDEEKGQDEEECELTLQRRYPRVKIIDIHIGAEHVKAYKKQNILGDHVKLLELKGCCIKLDKFFEELLTIVPEVEELIMLHVERFDDHELVKIYKMMYEQNFLPRSITKRFYEVAMKPISEENDQKLAEEEELERAKNKGVRNWIKGIFKKKAGQKSLQKLTKLTFIDTHPKAVKFFANLPSLVEARFDFEGFRFGSDQNLVNLTKIINENLVNTIENMKILHLDMPLIEENLLTKILTSKNLQKLTIRASQIDDEAFDAIVEAKIENFSVTSLHFCVPKNVWTSKTLVTFLGFFKSLTSLEGIGLMLGDREVIQQLKKMKISPSDVKPKLWPIFEPTEDEDYDSMVQDILYPWR